MGSPVAPSWLVRNRIFVVLWLAIFVGTVGMGIVSPLLPVFAEEMGATGIWLGLAFSGFAISQTPLMPIVGRLSDRLGRKRFIVGGLAIYALVGPGLAWSPGYHELVLFRVVGGIGAAMVFPVAYAYVGELSGKGTEGRYMGLFNTAFFLGWGVGPLIGGLLRDHFNMDATFYAMTALAGVALLVALIFLPKRRSDDLQFTYREEGASYSAILKDNIVRGLLSFQLAYGVNSAIVMSFVAVYMASALGANGTQIGALITARVILSGLLQTPFGYVADKVNKVGLITLGTTVMALGIFLVPWMASFTALLALFLIVAVFESITGPASMAIMAEKGRHYGMGTLSAMINIASSLGMLAGALLGGTVTDLWGLDNAFRFGALMGLLGVVAFNLFYIKGSRSIRAAMETGPALLPKGTLLP